MISFADKVSVQPHVLIRLLDKEAVLLNLETECYFGLDEIGTRMWQVTTAGPNIEFAYRQLLEEYDVDLSPCVRTWLTCSKNWLKTDC